MENLLNIFLLLLVLIIGTDSSQTRPNIVYFLADDLGYNDVGYHDCSIKTPVISQLAAEGIILENNYVAPLCAPSRAALLTGRYSFHVGYQSGLPPGDAPVCLTRENPILPEAMRDLGYNTYMLGKWHLGYCKEQCLPANRGFDRFFGRYQSQADYYIHITADLHLFDFHDDFPGDYHHDTCSYGNYSDFVLATQVNEYIDLHVSQNETKDNPFFIYFSSQTPHAPLQVPEEYLQMYLDEPDSDRRAIKAMVSVADDLLGNLLRKLREHNLYDNTIIIFSSDNGGDAGYSKNSPLRGGKYTVWEGGVRVPGFVHSPLLKESAGTVSHGLFHISDWFPTIVSLAGGTVPDYVDGYDQTDLVFNGGPSKRTVVPIHYDQYDPPSNGRAAIRVGKWKLIRGFVGRQDGYDSISTGPDALHSTYEEQGSDSDIQFDHENPFLIEAILNAENDIYLFDLEADPTERTNLAENRPEVVQELLGTLQGFADTAVERDPNYFVSSPRVYTESYRGLLTSGWC